MNIRLRNLTFILILSILISGCGARGTDLETPSPSPSSSPTSTAPTPTESSTPEPTETPKVTLLQEFRELALANAPPDEMHEALKRMIVQVPAAEADEFIRELEAYYETNLPAVEKKFEAENVQQELSAMEWPFTEAQIPNIKSDAARLLVEQSLAGGYKLDI